MFLLLQKVIEGLIPNSERERKDNIYQNLNLVSKERIFRYIVIFIFILTVIFNLPFGPNHLYGIVIAMTVIYIYIQHDTQNQIDLDDDYKLKYDFINEYLFVDKPFIVYDQNEDTNLYNADNEQLVSYFNKSRLMVNYLYDIRDFVTFNPPAYNHMLQNINNILKNRIQLELGLVNCSQTIDISIQEKDNALNNFQSIIYRLPSTDFSNEQFERNFEVLSELLEAEISYMKELCRVDQESEVINTLDRPYGIDYGPKPNPTNAIDYSDRFNFV